VTDVELVPERSHGDRVALAESYTDSELFCVSLGEGSQLYFAPLLGKCIVMSQVTGDPWALGADSPTLGQLRERGMVGAPPAKSGLGGEVEAANPVDPVGVILLLTDRCNLNCVYCYGSPVRTAARRMEWPVARAVVDYVMANARGHGVKCHVAFHGSGEPTLEVALIKQTVEYVRDKMADGPGADFSMVTNGTCSDDLVHWMGQNMASIQVSLDGPHDLHETQRPMRYGGESWARTVRALTILQHYDTKLLVKSTITANSASQLEEITAFLCEATELKRFHFGLVVPVPDVDERWGAPDSEVFLRQLKAARRIAWANGAEIVVSAAEEAFPKVRRRYCGVTMPNLAVTPEGEFTACYQVASTEDPRWGTYVYGGVDEHGGCVVDEGKKAAIAKLSPRTIGLCVDCFCRWQCDGDCLARLPGTSVESYDIRCRVNRALIRDSLLGGQVRA
jgi:radical SAM protein with 4Fe4S-binding SPASM domain